MKYNFFRYNQEKNAVIITDADGKELVIDCEKAEAGIVFEEPEDEGYLARLATREPAAYVSYALKPDGLQGYVEAMNVFN